MRKNRIVSRIFTCLIVALAAVSVLAADTATVRLVLDVPERRYALVKLDGA